ncbi:MAG: Asp-tRNA(Asn)/Glu-tRNA(Gln) amidotransferase subunit GatC [Desulfonatronovibrionaceae bacterium]
MNITRQQIEDIANLARLELKPDQARKFASQFNEIISYMDKMNAQDTQGVEPLYTPTSNTSILRPDEVKKEFQREEMLAAAPEQDGQFFVVPKIL